MSHDAFASAVQDRRRATGLSTRDLATVSGVSEDVVRRIETGDVVAVQDAASVCLALDLPVARHVAGSGRGGVPVAHADAAHAHAMSVIRAQARDDGWLAFPDVLARSSSEGWPDDMDAVVAVASRKADMARFLTIGVCLCCMPTMAAGMLLSGHGFLDSMSGAFTVSGCALVPVLASIGMGVRFDRVTDRVAELRRTAEARAEMTARGFTVTSDGVTVWQVTGDGLTRTDHPASTVIGVGARDEGTDHVTVTLDTVSGRVVMPWLWRSADLVAAVRTMAEAATARNGNVPGRRYVVREAGGVATGPIPALP